jgi:hypothetical protein
VTAVPAGLASPATGTPSSSASAAASTAGANDGATGGVLTVTANAKFGIPCVF